MGKTFKSNGYLSLHHSFNSLKKHQLNKKYDRHKKRMLHFNYHVSEFEDNGIHINVHRQHKVRNNIRYPNKIGYNPSTDVTLQDICNRLLPNFAVGARNKKARPCHHFDKLHNYHTEFANMSESEKIDFIEKYHISDNGSVHDRWFKNLQKMNKQIKRRNALGYFKGHDKTKHNE